MGKALYYTCAMMNRTLVKHVLDSEVEMPDVLIQGWVRTRRDSKTFSFLEVNDGSSVASLQVVADEGIPGYERIGEMATGSAVSIRGALVAGHRFFQERDFSWVSTPIITASDCEGAGEMFRVTTLDVGDAASRDASRDFFGKAAYLTVSGQLEGEAFACALSNIYTFGPTFRAENSNTTRHAAEFWMVEPEMAFCDLYGDMDMAEEFVRFLVGDALANSAEEVEFLTRFVDKGLWERLEHVKETPFVRCSYTEAVDILLKSGKTFDYPVSWGINLQSEHERFLTEEHFKCPVIVYN